MAKAYSVVGVRIDIETRSSEDIKSGSYRYSESPDFKVLVLAYSLIRRYAGGAERLAPVKLLDLTDQRKCSAFVRTLENPSFQKHAYNANFERVSLSRWAGLPTGKYLDPENWRCSAVRANVSGIFGGLDEAAKELRTPVSKDPKGKQLIRMFSIPMSSATQKRALASCGCSVFHAPAAHLDDFADFERYCATDVVTEALVASCLPDIPDDVQAQYEADQRINDRGIRHFSGLSKQAVYQVEAEKVRLMSELGQLTGLPNPNSVQQFRGWLDQEGYPMLSTDKEHREEALKDPLVPSHVAKALILKGSASLSSVAKHNAALRTRSGDGRIRGSLRFYGAHTGREAGQGIQVQNLPRYEASAADRATLLRGKAGADAPRIAKGTVRSSLVPAKGNLLMACDYNAIEGRTLGWLAGEKWVLDEFTHGGGKLYEATAAQMFSLDKAALVADLNLCGKCGICTACDIRNRGKVSALALQYLGGAGALVSMGAEEFGIDIGNYKTLHREWVARGSPGKFHEWEPDRHHYPALLDLRDRYRNGSVATTSFWKQCAEAWDLSALQGKAARFGDGLVLSMLRDGLHNRMVLPSGRSIWYRKARSIEEVRRDGSVRVDRRTFIGKRSTGRLGVLDIHGGVLTNNATQGTARDVLFDLIMKIEALTAKGWPGRIVIHVHDEVVVEAPSKQAQQCLDDVLGLMSEPPDWAPGLPVKGAGTLMERYGK